MMEKLSQVVMVSSTLQSLDMNTRESVENVQETLGTAPAWTQRGPAVPGLSSPPTSQHLDQESAQQPLPSPNNRFPSVSPSGLCWVGSLFKMEGWGPSTQKPASSRTPTSPPWERQHSGYRQDEVVMTCPEQLPQPPKPIYL